MDILESLALVLQSKSANFNYTRTRRTLTQVSRFAVYLGLLYRLLGRSLVVWPKGNSPFGAWVARVYRVKALQSLDWVNRSEPAPFLYLYKIWRCSLRLDRGGLHRCKRWRKQMIKLLLVVMGLLSFSFASIHPGLKKAVDNGDVKTAENLVKRIGVHDVYCPKELSVENALIIYENIFSQSPEKMWDKCDPFFIKKAEGDVCKLSVPLCRYYLQNLLLDEEFEKLNTAFENIIQSKLYIQKEKRVIEQQDVVETSQKECLELLNGTY